MPDQPVGVKRVRDEMRGLVAAEQAGKPEPEQLDLLSVVPTRFKPGTEEHTAMVEAIERARAGRPKGARQLHARDMLKFCRERFCDPMLERFRMSTHTVETFAKEMNCSKLEAYDRLEKLLADLCRYQYAPLAPVDDHGQAVVPNFQLLVSQSNGGGEALSGAGELLSQRPSGRLPPWLNPNNPTHADEIAAWRAAHPVMPAPAPPPPSSEPENDPAMAASDAVGDETTSAEAHGRRELFLLWKRVMASKQQLPPHLDVNRPSDHPAIEEWLREHPRV